MYYGYIYRIHNKVNGFSYIGQTIQKKAEHRFNMHIKKLNDNKHHNYLLQKDWKKYGKDNFDFQIIQTLKYRYKDKLLYKINEAEIYFIQYFESMFDSYGYNLQIGGNNWQVLTKPVRERISSSLHANMLEKLKEQKEDLIKAYIDFNLGYKRSYVLNKYKISKHSLYSLQNKKGQPWKVIENDIEERIEPYRAIIHIHNNLKNNSGYKNCKLNLLELIEIDKLLRHKTMEKEQIANKYNISYSILEKISRRDSIYKYIFLEIENYEKKGDISMGAEHRLLKLEEKLITLGFDETLRAVDLMKNEMSAAKGHKRHDGSDYYYHLSDVTLILVNAGIKDQPTLTGSMNHDFPEDVKGISVETVKHLFGEEVSRAVGPLTKVKGINYRDLANLKAYYGLLIDSRVSEKPVLSNWRSSVIKAGDIMHNMSTLGDASRDKKIRKIQEAKEVYIPFLREARNKFPRFASFFYLAKFAIEPIISEMEARYEKEIQQEERIKYLESKLGMDKNASLY